MYKRQHQLGITQHFEVFGDGRTAELEPVAEFPRGQRPPSEDLEQFPPHGIRQGLKDMVGGGHGGNIRRRFPTCQPFPTYALSPIGGYRPGCALHLAASGRRRIYRLTAEPLAELGEWLHPFEKFWRARLAELAEVAEELK